MAVVRRAPSGAFVMSYEICGSDGCAAHLRFSADGWDWGDPRDRGLRPASLDGKHFRHAPTLAASATPGANGRLFLVGQLAFDGAGAQSADSGTILLGNTEGGGGNWYELAAPVAVADAYDNFCPNYSSAILPLEHGQVALEIASRWDGNRCRPYYARGPLAGTRDATGLSDGAAYRMTAVISGLCADIELGSTAPGANLRQWACNDSDAQRFTVAFQPDGSAQLKYVASGLCLAAAGDATTPGTNVEQQPCTDATTWQLAAVGRGYYQVRRRGAAGLPRRGRWLGGDGRERPVVGLQRARAADLALRSLTGRCRGQPAAPVGRATARRPREAAHRRLRSADAARPRIVQPGESSGPGSGTVRDRGLRMTSSSRFGLLALLATLAAASPARADAVPAGLINSATATEPGPGFRPLEPGPAELTSTQRRARAELVRDAAASVGMTNAALLAGIAEVETNFAHCWSEATWACQGPPSSSCGGGPVIAGASDGPCSAQQGGLGMFQFDSGTFSQTIATYGPDIVTVHGNVAAVVPFLVTRAIESVQGVNSPAEALAWMNSITIQDGDPKYEAWLYFVAWRYNGCQGCTSQINKYRGGTNTLRDEFGPDFWTISTTPPAACDVIPAAGRTIEETESCFAKRGTATSWYPGDRGNGGACLYTYTTADPAADNQATWELRFETAGRYRVEVFTDGGDLSQSRQAKYVVTHAAGTTEVVIDQSAEAGFRSLGDFDFAAGAPFSVSLGDNTGEAYVTSAKIGITFDAVRVAAAGSPLGDSLPDGTSTGDGSSDGGGGCNAGGGSPGAGLVLALGLLAVSSRRRRAS